MTLGEAIDTYEYRDAARFETWEHAFRVPQQSTEAVEWRASTLAAVNTSKTKNLRFAGIGFAVAAIAFGVTGNWLLALAFALFSISFIVNSNRIRSEPEGEAS